MERIKIKYHGFKRRGIDIINSKNEILMSAKPYQFSKDSIFRKDKYFISVKAEKFPHSTYGTIKDINRIERILNDDDKSYFLLVR